MSTSTPQERSPAVAGPMANTWSSRPSGWSTGAWILNGILVYVTTTDGNTGKVSVPTSSTITKSVTTKLLGVHPATP